VTDYALAEAFVQIRPDTTGFQAETEAKIKAALAAIHPEVTVKVVPDVAGFQAVLKTALAKALGSTGKATIPVKVAFDIDDDSLTRQLALLKAKMAQTGLVDFLDYDLPIGKIQYQIALLRRRVWRCGRRCSASWATSISRWACPRKTSPLKPRRSRLRP
jgi:hypothetical protein